MSTSPAVSARGKVLFVGSVFNGMKYGSYEVMRRLLHQYSAESFGIVSAAYRSDAAYDFADRAITVGVKKLPQGKLGALVGLLQIPFMALQALRWCRGTSYVSLVAVHPSMDMLLLALVLSKILRLPLFPYLHDTIVEAQEKSRLAFLARWTQRLVFGSARRVLVMSEGMRAYYQRKYHLDSVVLPHIYAERVPIQPSVLREKTLFWSGGIYGINDHAVLDVVRAASTLGVTTRITAAGGLAKERVLSWRGEGLLVEAVYYPERGDYVEALTRQGAHVLALNDSLQSDFGEGELSTIFPTKTPDYLASGRPIMVYCPERYELAAYFQKHKCGIVVTRSEDLPNAIRKVLSDDSDVQECVQNGLGMMSGFDPCRVAGILSSAIDG